MLLCGDPDRVTALLGRSRLGRELCDQLRWPEQESGWNSIALRLDNREPPWRMQAIGDWDSCLSGRIVGGDAKAGQEEQLRLAYAKYGSGFAAQLNGEFAFAVHDRSAGSIQAGIDLFGCRGLYYYLADDVLLISTCVSAIIAVLRPALALDEQAIAAFLVPFADACLDRGDTFYRSLQVLRGGEGLRVDLRSRRVQRVDLPIPGQLLAEGAARSAKEAQAAISAAMGAALRERIHGPTAALALSGGIDSALIACALAQLREERDELEIHALTSVLRGRGGEEEARCAEHTAQQCGLGWHPVPRDPGPLQFPIASPVPWAEEPMALCDDLSQVRALHQHGLPAFSGMGADELIATSLRRPGRRVGAAGRWKRRLDRMLLRRFRKRPQPASTLPDLAQLMADRAPAWVVPELHASLPASAIGNDAASAQSDWTELLCANSGFRTDVEGIDRGGLFQADLSLPFLDHRVVVALLDPAVAQMDLDRWPQQPPKQCLRGMLRPNLGKIVSRRPKSGAGMPAFARFAKQNLAELTADLRKISELQQFVRLKNLPEVCVDTPWATLYPLLVCASLGAWFVHQSGVEEQWRITSKK